MSSIVALRIFEKTGAFSPKRAKMAIFVTEECQKKLLSLFIRISFFGSFFGLHVL